MMSLLYHLHSIRPFVPHRCKIEVLSNMWHTFRDVILVITYMYMCHADVKFLMLFSDQMSALHMPVGWCVTTCPLNWPVS